MFKTHLLFALFISLIIFKNFDLNSYIFILVLVFSSIFPDIDHGKSWIGRRIKPLSFIVNFIFGHRKFIHSLFFALILSFLVNYFFGDYYIPFLIGFLCHLILDILTKEGVMILYPFKFRIHGFIKTNGIVEKGFLIFLMIVNFIWFIKYIF